MLNAIKKCWSPGVTGSMPGQRRQVELGNQLGLFGALATFPYQLFYFFYDFDFYRAVFIANLVFVGAYLSVLLLNYLSRYSTAKKLLLVNACIQIFVITWFLSAGAGVHLFYFCLASVLVFLFNNLRLRTYISLMALFCALYVTAHFLFSPALAITPVPLPWVNVMYAVSVICVLSLLGGLLYLLRQQIDAAEDELTLNKHYFEALSNTDALTGLPNRRMLDEAFEREWERLTRQPGTLSVIMCDVDYFKKVNDHYGHDGGDRCLQRIATALESLASRTSDLVARYGGEEFAFVLPSTGEKGARYLGEQVCEAVRALAIPNPGASSGFITISIGIASIDVPDGGDIDAKGSARLLKRADEALYQAKTNGRNQVVFLPYLHSYTSTEQ
ncbi:GGDEF domain-containing protein [Vreelandella populi]|nr:GGDEF domain-containing protein [Halomonas populi]